jgi:two-component system LytT family response regulator
MIKVVIIDDEINAQIVLKNTIERYFPNKFSVVDLCNSVCQGVKSINEHNPELVFLDIQMPGENGFELFKYFKVLNFEVIFTTAYEKFALKAIKCSALDYLLKPINHLDLASSLKLFETRYQQSSGQKKLTLLLENLNLDNQNSYKIAFPTIDGFELIHSNQILYCKADSNYCLIKKVDESTIIVTKTLKYVEELMPQKNFKRIHKTYVSNLNYIVRYNKTLKEVELTNGEKLPVSFRKEEEFVKTILHKE